MKQGIRIYCIRLYQWSSTFFVQSPPYTNFARKSLPHSWF